MQCSGHGYYAWVQQLGRIWSLLMQCTCRQTKAQMTWLSDEHSHQHQKLISPTISATQYYISQQNESLQAMFARVWKYKCVIYSFYSHVPSDVQNRTADSCAIQAVVESRQQVCIRIIYIAAVMGLWFFVSHQADTVSMHIHSSSTVDASMCHASNNIYFLNYKATW